MKEYYLSLLRKLEYEERAGELLAWSQIEGILGGIIDAQRAAFLHLPTRAASVLASETDQRRIKAILTEMVHQILAELSETEFDTTDGRLVQRTRAASNRGGHG